MTSESRREIVARHLHTAYCGGCTVGYRPDGNSGAHVSPLREWDYAAADRLLSDLDSVTTGSYAEGGDGR